MSSSLSRRGLVKSALVASGAALAVAVPTVYAIPRRPPIKVLKFHNTHTGENLQAVFWANGKLVEEGYQKINWNLRDHRQSEATDMDVDLMHLLFDLNRTLETWEPFHVISGFRSAKTNAMLRRRSTMVARRSYHTLGQAIDIRVPGVSTRNLQRASLSQSKRGGVGIYSGSAFVHVDTGPVRQWGR